MFPAERGMLPTHPTPETQASPHTLDPAPPPTEAAEGGNGATRTAARWAAGVVAGMLGLRLALTAWVALGDITESRYATIALHMARSGDWITPWVYYDGTLLPFWGKPPLHFWLTAVAFKLLGAAAWTARAPGMLAGAATLALAYAFARRFWSPRVAATTAVVLASSLLFFISTGVSATDMTLTCAITATMVAFARTVTAERPRARRWWGLALALALAAGSLVKGPIAVILPGAAIFLWLALTRRWRLLGRLPWLTLCGVYLVVTVPWFLLAERATPGFLRYFLINEHVLRYLEPNYGDRYGSGNQRPWGTVWAFLLAGGLPWSGLSIAALVRSRRRRRQSPPGASDPWLAYALLWGLTPAAFFTFARQIEPSYPLPGVAGLAIATAAALVAWADSERRRSLLRALAGHLVLVAAVLAFLACLGLRWHAPVWVIAAAALLAPATAWLAHRLSAADDAAGLVGALGAATLAVAVITVALYRPALDDGYSARTILARLHASPATARRTPVFPVGTPYSASFYSLTTGGPAVEQHHEGGAAYLEARLRAGGDNVYVLRAADWDALDRALRDRLRVVERTAAWVACLPAS
jgi:4-amino-4-deoxy-L-arabinose transferase-like glycosyltransferase